MRNLQFIMYKVVLLVGAWVAMSCDHEEEVMPLSEREVQIEVCEETLTRAGKETFAVGDSIGVYAVPRASASSTTPAMPGATGNRAHNAKWVKTEEGWRPATIYDIILWDATGRPLDFYAYYPYRADAVRPDSIILSVEADQSLRSRVRHSDVLRAVNDKGCTEGTVELRFDHVFAMTDVQLQKPADITINMMNGQARFSNVVTTVAMHIGTSEMRPVQRGMVTICPLDWWALHFQGVLPPQSFAVGESTFMFDNVTAAYIFPLPAVTLRSGMLHHFALELKNDL